MINLTDNRKEIENQLTYNLGIDALKTGGYLSTTLDGFYKATDSVIKSVETEIDDLFVDTANINKLEIYGANQGMPRIKSKDINFYSSHKDLKLIVELYKPTKDLQLQLFKKGDITVSDIYELTFYTNVNYNSNKADTNQANVNQPNNSNQASTVATAAATKNVANGEPAEINADVDAEINTNTEVGKRDLTVLKRISLEPRKPVILTKEQIVERYDQAMEALYQPVTTPLSAEDVDTLINIATLVPQLFEDAEIAGRLSAKSPALARLVIQHQVWEQIEAQQVLDMQQMKQNQQQEFEMLMEKFNETIKGYDEQIAKYEQTLKEFK